MGMLDDFLGILKTFCFAIMITTFLCSGLPGSIYIFFFCSYFVVIMCCLVRFLKRFIRCRLDKPINFIYFIGGNLKAFLMQLFGEVGIMDFLSFVEDETQKEAMNRHVTQNSGR